MAAQSVSNVMHSTTPHASCCFLKSYQVGKQRKPITVKLQKARKNCHQVKA